MSKERELLKRVRDTLLELKETHYDLYWDIQTALDHPSLDLREALSKAEIFNAWIPSKATPSVHSFAAGVRFAEKHYGITGVDDEH